MNKEEYNKELENIVNKDCQKIMAEIIELYNNKVEVNKNFYSLVKEKINPKYLYLLECYYSNIIKFIPENLYVCPNGKWALVTEQEFDEIMLEDNSLGNNPYKRFSKIVDNIIDELLYSENFFESVNKYLEPLYQKGYTSRERKYIIDEIYYGLKKRGYTIKCIDPLEINSV